MVPEQAGGEWCQSVLKQEYAVTGLEVTLIEMRQQEKLSF